MRSLSTPLATSLQRRLASTVTGRSGRLYTLGSELQRNPYNRMQSIHEAEYVLKPLILSWKNIHVFVIRSHGEKFAVKRIPPSHFGRLRSLETRLASSSQHLRVHTDHNEEESTLMYPFYKSTLLRLIQEDKDFPPEERRVILRRVGEGLQELHSRDWMHAGNINRTYFTTLGSSS